MKSALRFFIGILLLLCFNIYGQTWNSVTSPGADNQLGKIFFVNNSEGWIFHSPSGGANLYHTVNGGASWSTVNFAGSDTVWNTIEPARNLSFVSASVGYVAAIKGKAGGDNTSTAEFKGALVYKTTNGGTDWTKMSFSGWDAAIDIKFLDANNGYVSVMKGTFNNVTGYGIYRTTNGGQDWTATTQSGLFFSFANTLVGWSGAAQIMKTENGGDSWTTQYTLASGVYVLSVIALTPQIAYVETTSGIILRTIDGGANWTQLTNTVFNGYTFSGEATWYFLDANNGWIGGKNGSGSEIVIFHTSDGGTNWEKQSTPFTKKIFSIFFSDASHGWAVNDNGELARFGSPVAIDNDKNIPVNFELSQNYPNPFNPTTIINYTIPKDAHVTVKVYDVTGRVVSVPVDEHKSAGSHKLYFNAAGLAAGVYLYTLSTGELYQTKKFVLLK